VQLCNPSRCGNCAGTHKPCCTFRDLQLCPGLCVRLSVGQGARACCVLPARVADTDAAWRLDVGSRAQSQADACVAQQSRGQRQDVAAGAAAVLSVPVMSVGIFLNREIAVVLQGIFFPYVCYSHRVAVQAELQCMPCCKEVACCVPVVAMLQPQQCCSSMACH
jgi:hypothetical protein